MPEHHQHAPPEGAGQGSRRPLVAAFFVFYLLALGASHWVRARSSATSPLDGPAPNSTLQSVTLGDDEPVELAYRRWGADSTEALPWVLIHGSPGSSSNFTGLAQLMPPQTRLLALDLPGFGQSTRQVSDYSILAHSFYLEQWLDALGIERAHFLGFSMGGGVAIELAERSPDRMASLTLLSAIGAQEYELFGSYQLNHAVHGAQLGALRLLTACLPHFGWLDRFPLNVAYARNFYDTDQRPLRGYLERFKAPLLIVHGVDDPLVPVAAAHEHHRIVPQSELIVLDSDHFMTFSQPELLAPLLIRFSQDVESGRAVTRREASAERMQKAALPFDPQSLPKAAGLVVAIWFVLLAVATFVSEDLTSISAGLLVAQGRIEWLTACLACFVGIFLGDIALFLAGRWLGRPWLHRRPLVWFLSPSRIDSASTWLSDRGPTVIFLSRFTPGLRLPTYFAAGVLRTSFASFTLYFAAAVALWVPLLVGASALFGEPLLDQVERLGGASFGWILGLAFVLLGCLNLARKLATATGRKQLASRLTRTLRWEFWPPWVFYPPVVVWILYLGAKHRCLTLFTAANPGLPAGGFVGESKSDILDSLPYDSVATYQRLPGSLSLEQRLRRTDAFQKTLPQAYPLVIKPDVGERGSGVGILHRQQEVVNYLRHFSEDAILQRYVPGTELGVFYVRRPGEDQGQIFSLTDKQLPVVVGDGVSSLAELIRANPRTNALADQYLGYANNPAERVLSAGEAHTLVEVGAHCMGAIFVSGERFRTEALEQAIDRLSQAIPGFYFGRFDIRAETEDQLRRGSGLQILELNGVSSEATHIYDAGMSLWDAYKVLFKQWQLAFEIGHLNRLRGASVTPLRELIEMIRSN